jgi:hypothetical protein
MSDIFYWLLSDGSPVLAALILGIFVVGGIFLWKKIRTTRIESAFLQGYERGRSENERLRNQLTEKIDSLQEEVSTVRKDRDAIEKTVVLLKSARADASASAVQDATEGVRAEFETNLHETRAYLKALAHRFANDTARFVEDSLTSSNFATSKKRIESAFVFCEKQGMPLDAGTKAGVLDALKVKYEEVVRKEYARQEQARIKAQIREEQRLEAERQRELQRLENQQLAIETALQRALARAEDEHSVEVERLREQLREAHERFQRAKSQAELTRAGFVYVISNIGSFGDKVFKVGMTRRLEPMERIHELSGAAVPFPYDVHMMISSEDAPALENALHKDFHRMRLNKVNFRKEFFRIDLDTIRQLVEKYHGKVDYLAEPEALEYHNSIEMEEEDLEFVESVLEKAQPEETE